MEIEQVSLLEDAENCRRMALAYLGQPEATFFIKAAMAFEDLADAADRSRCVLEVTP